MRWVWSHLDGTDMGPERADDGWLRDQTDEGWLGWEELPREGHREKGELTASLAVLGGKQGQEELGDQACAPSTHGALVSCPRHSIFVLKSLISQHLRWHASPHAPQCCASAVAWQHCRPFLLP